MSILFPVMRHSRLASAGDMGGIIGKKLGLGKLLALPVIKQNDIFLYSHPHQVAGSIQLLVFLNWQPATRELLRPHLDGASMMGKKRSEQGIGSTDLTCSSSAFLLSLSSPHIKRVTEAFSTRLSGASSVTVTAAIHMPSLSQKSSVPISFSFDFQTAVINQKRFIITDNHLMIK